MDCESPPFLEENQKISTAVTIEATRKKRAQCLGCFMKWNHAAFLAFWTS
jgi:hypothetical protein